MTCNWTLARSAKVRALYVSVVIVDDYVYLVPFVESEKEIFLKTIIPSRKATKEYLGESDERT